MFIGSSVLLAQEKTVAPCQTYNAMDQVFANDPSARVRYNEEQEKLRLATIAYEESLKNKKVGAAFQYTIPVVFHILHTYGSENIPDANCIAALANMNNDYAATGSDKGTINPTFAPLYINSDIKLMLAHRDPLGNCTNGIVHHYNVNTTWNQAAPNYAYTGTGAGQWNPTKYLNIYVVKSICPSSATCSTSGGIIQGYTYKPGTWATGSPADCFVVISTEVNNNIQSARTLSHEIGHWLNLSHTWGNTNNPGVACGDEGVADTPITKGFFSTCPGSPYSGCSASENVENIMDYSSCVKMFTTGQTNVMRATLASGTSGRNNLWTTTNVGPTQTDVNGTALCSPIADFYTTFGTATSVYTVCAGGTLGFTDASYNATVTSRSWAATGGATIASPTAAVTNITFPTMGIQSVSLTVTNGAGSNTVVKTVNVLNGVANYAATYQESFEGASLPTNWSIINQTGGVTWQKITTVAATGSNSYYMSNNTNPNGAIDILETPSYDFLNNPGAMFTFKYAYARNSATFNDVFKVQASSNCGGSWSDIYVPSAATMASGSGGTTSSPFFATPAQFKTYTLTTHPAFNTFKSQPNVKIRFYWQEDATNGFGNNFFLDDVNFNGTLGVNELTKSIGFVVYPNPTSGTATIEFTLNDNSAISYSVIDVIGRVVEQQKTLNLAPGHHAYTINESNTFKPGIYFVSFELNGQKMSRKLIVE
ncbi:MAG: T9SS type A sorting domain-containing protein [Sphingobacteriaceae bacterium]|nr:T9SS type A sorting domain-containing protein [Sphingobacteriaceae bacterium]